MPIFTGQHKRHDPPYSLLLVFLLLFSTNACTVKHAHVTPGLIPKGKMITIQDEQFGQSLFTDLKKENELCPDDPRYDQLVTVCNHLTQVQRWTRTLGSSIYSAIQTLSMSARCMATIFLFGRGCWIRPKARMKSRPCWPMRWHMR